MYRVQRPTNGEDEQFVNTFINTLHTNIMFYMNGGTSSVTLRDKNKTTVTIGLEPMSLTSIFLTKLSRIETLRHFLLLTPQQQRVFIDRLHKFNYPDELVFNKLTFTSYKKYKIGSGLVFDSFNDICYDIFVVKGYGEAQSQSIINKTVFITNTKLKVCPYCGEESIAPTARTKKQIDHFLPKRKYPFFALSYYNLVPSCQTCNQIGHKGENDPIENNDSIVNPYLFNPQSIRFHVKLLGVDIYDCDNDNLFNIVLGFKSKQSLLGYDKFFDISDRMSKHNDVVAEDYRRLIRFLKTKGYYKDMPFDQTWLDEAFDSTLSFSPQNNKPENKLFYRLRMDVFEQFTVGRNPETYYTKRAYPNPEILE